MYVLPGLALIAIVGGLFVFNYYQSKDAKVNQEQPQQVAAEQKVESAAAETLSTENKDTSSKPPTQANAAVAAKPQAPSGAYDITLSTTSVSFVAGGFSAKITARTTDGRAVQWTPNGGAMVNVGSGGAVVSYEELQAKKSEYTFWLSGKQSANTAPGTYAVTIEANDGTRRVTKNVSATVTPAPTFDFIAHPEQATLDAEGRTHVPVQFVRTGSNAAIAVELRVQIKPAYVNEITFVNNGNSGEIVIAHPQSGLYNLSLSGSMQGAATRRVPIQFTLNY